MGLRTLIERTSTIPVANPPTWAHQAIPLEASKPAPRPERIWITIQTSRKRAAGTRSGGQSRRSWLVGYEIA